MCSAVKKTKHLLAQIALMHSPASPQNGQRSLRLNNIQLLCKSAKSVYGFPSNRSSFSVQMCLLCRPLGRADILTLIFGGQDNLLIPRRSACLSVCLPLQIITSFHGCEQTETGFITVSDGIGAH